MRRLSIRRPACLHFPQRLLTPWKNPWLRLDCTLPATCHLPAYRQPSRLGRLSGRYRHRLLRHRNDTPARHRPCLDAHPAVIAREVTDHSLGRRKMRLDYILYGLHQRQQTPGYRSKASYCRGDVSAYEAHGLRRRQKGLTRLTRLLYVISGLT